MDQNGHQFKMAAKWKPSWIGGHFESLAFLLELDIIPKSICHVVKPHHTRFQNNNIRTTTPIQKWLLWDLEPVSYAELDSDAAASCPPLPAEISKAEDCDVINDGYTCLDEACSFESRDLVGVCFVNINVCHKCMDVYTMNALMNDKCTIRGLTGMMKFSAFSYMIQLLNSNYISHCNFNRAISSLEYEYFVM